MGDNAMVLQPSGSARGSLNISRAAAPIQNFIPKESNASSDLQEANRQLCNELESVTAELQQKTEENKQLQTQLTHSEGVIADMEQEMNDLQFNLNSLQDKVDVLEKERQTISIEPPTFKEDSSGTIQQMERQIKHLEDELEIHRETAGSSRKVADQQGQLLAQIADQELTISSLEKFLKAQKTDFDNELTQTVQDFQTRLTNTQMELERVHSIRGELQTELTRVKSAASDSEWVKDMEGASESDNGEMVHATLETTEATQAAPPPSFEPTPPPDNIEEMEAMQINIDEQQAVIKELETKSQRQQTTISEFKKESATLRAKLQEVEKNMSGLKKVIAQREGALSEQNQLASEEFEQQLQMKDDELTLKEFELKETQERLQEQEQHFGKLKQVLSDKTAEIQEMQRSVTLLQEKEQIAADYKAEVQRQQMALHSAEQRLREKSNYADELKQRVEVLVKSHEDFRRQAESEMDHQAEERHTVIEHMQDELEKVHRDNKNLTQTVAEQKKVIAMIPALESKIAELQNLVNNMEADLKRRDDLIVQMDEQIGELKEKEQMLHHMRSMYGTGDGQIFEDGVQFQSNRLSVLTDELDEVQRTVREQNDQILSLTAELEQKVLESEASEDKQKLITKLQDEKQRNDDLERTMIKLKVDNFMIQDAEIDVLAETSKMKEDYVNDMLELRAELRKTSEAKKELEIAFSAEKARSAEAKQNLDIEESRHKIVEEIVHEAKDMVDTGRLKETNVMLERRLQESEERANNLEDKLREVAEQRSIREGDLRVSMQQERRVHDALINATGEKEQLTAELKKLKDTLFNKEVNFEKVEKARQSLESEVSGNVTSMRSKVHELEIMTMKAQGLASDLTKSKREAQVLKNEVDSLQHLKNTLTLEKTRLQSQVQNLEGVQEESLQQREALLDEKARSLEELRYLRDEKIVNNKDLEARQHDNERLMGQCEQLKESINALQAALQQKNLERDASLADKSAALMEMEKFQAEAHHLSSVVEGLNADLEAERGAKAKLQMEAAELQSLLSETKAKQDQFDGTILEYQQQMQDANQDKELKMKEFTSIQRTLEDAKSQIHSLELKQQQMLLELEKETKASAKVSAENTKLRSELAVKAADADVLMDQVKTLEAQPDLQKKAEEYAQKVRDYQHRLNESEARVEDLNRNLNRVASEQEALQLEKQGLLDKLSALQHKMEGQVDASDALTMERDSLKQQLGLTKQELESSRQHLQSITESSRSRHEQMLKAQSVVQDELDKTKTDLNNVQQQVVQVNEELSAYKKSSTSTQAEHTTEIRNFQAEVRRLQDEAESTVRQKQSLQEQVDSLTRENQSLALRFKGLDDDLVEQNRTLATSQDEVSSLRQIAQTRQAEAEGYKNQIDAMQEMLNSKTREYDTQSAAMRKQSEEASSVATQMNAAIKDLERELSARNGQYEELAKYKDRLEENHRVATAEKQAAQDRIGALESAVHQHAAMRDAVALERDSLRQELTILSDEHIATKSQLKDVGAGAKVSAEVEHLLSQARGENKALSDKLSEMTQDLQDLNKRNDATAMERDSLRGELALLKDEHTKLNDKMVSLEEEQQNVQIASGKANILLEEKNSQALTRAAENETLRNEIARLKIESETLERNLRGEMQGLEMSLKDVSAKKDRMAEELVSRKNMLEAAIHEAEHTMVSAEQAVEAKSNEMREISREKEAVEAELVKTKRTNQLLESRFQAVQEVANATSSGAAQAEREALLGQIKSLQDEVARTAGAGQAGMENIRLKADLTRHKEVIEDLTNQRQLMADELASRKIMLESAIKEAERTMNSAETAVESKSKEIRELMTDKQRMMAEVSMHKAEKEALIEDRQKLQRQMMAIKADKETMEERLAAYQR